MAGNTFGRLFRVTTWGESHGRALGAVIDGAPAGLPLSERDIQPYLNRRRPGQNRFTTSRAEADRVEILSGVFEGMTTGTPISLIVFNTDQRSSDYTRIKDCYRPGHADFGFDQKYGFRDYRGGGRSSGRETTGRVCGGAVAAKVLRSLGVRLVTWTSSIGPVQVDPARADYDHILSSPLYMPDKTAEEEALAYLETCALRRDSSGSSVACRITDLPAGIGEPVFDKLDALLGQAMFSIGAVKAVEIGDGTKVSRSHGSLNNDRYVQEDGQVRKLSNHAGGILGGMSDGSDILLTVHFKPTPSIGQPQMMLHADGTVSEEVIGGRHDPVIGPRAAVVVESMAAITVLDLLLQDRVVRMDELLRGGRETE